MAQYENIENYEFNKGWAFFLFLEQAAIICQDKEYIKERYHPEPEKVAIIIGSNEKKQKGVPLHEV